MAQEFVPWSSVNGGWAIRTRGVSFVWGEPAFDTVDGNGRNPAPPKKPQNDDSPAHGFKAVQNFVHPE